MNWKAIAEAAYRVYRRRMLGQPAFDGLIPEWGELLEHEQDAWVAAVDEACHVHVCAAMA